MFFWKASAPPPADNLLAYAYDGGSELHVTTYRLPDQPRSITTFTEPARDAAIGNAILRHLAEYGPNPDGRTRIDDRPSPTTLPIRIKTENKHIEFFATRYQVGNLLHVSTMKVPSNSKAKAIGKSFRKFIAEVYDDMNNHRA